MIWTLQETLRQTTFSLTVTCAHVPTLKNFKTTLYCVTGGCLSYFPGQPYQDIQWYLLKPLLKDVTVSQSSLDRD